MQALYAFEVAGGDPEDIVRRIITSHVSDDRTTHRFAERLFLRTLDGAEEADEIINEHVKNWELGRIALIDHLVLRMAICELLTFEDIPPKVTINEAIEVAKRYSTDKSGKFVNGVLDAALLDLQRQGRLKKSGRGLVGMQSLQRRTTS